MRAKYYVYRNLRTGGFSIRYRGRVINRLFTFVVYGVELKVNESGRQKVIQTRQKNVHAFVVADKYIAKKYPYIDVTEVDKYNRITYNPYIDTHFMCNGKKIQTAKQVAFQNGICYLIKE